MKRYLIYILLIGCLIACRSKLKPRELGNYKYTTSSVDKRDSKYLVLAWGRGTSEDEALKEAKRNAVKDILYQGLTSGNPNVRITPVLMGNGAETKNADFNATFFQKDGAYLKYVEFYDEAISQSRSKKIRKSDRILNSAIEFQLLVDRDLLVRDLKQEGLLK